MNKMDYRITPLKSYNTGAKTPTEKLSQYMLDNGSNCNILGNRDLAWNIHKVDPTTIRGMGTVTVTEMGECIFGPCFLAPIPFNIVAQINVSRRYSLKLDTDVSPHKTVGGNVEWRLGDHDLHWLWSLMASVQEKTELPDEVFALVSDDTPPRHYSADERRPSC